MVILSKEKDLRYYKQVCASDGKIIIEQGKMLQEKMTEIKKLKAARDFYHRIVRFYNDVFGRVMDGS